MLTRYTTYTVVKIIIKLWQYNNIMTHFTDEYVHSPVVPYMNYQNDIDDEGYLKTNWASWQAQSYN